MKLVLLGNTNSLAAAASGLGVLPLDTETPVRTETAVIPASSDRQLHHNECLVAKGQSGHELHSRSKSLHTDANHIVSTALSLHLHSSEASAPILHPLRRAAARICQRIFAQQANGCA